MKSVNKWNLEPQAVSLTEEKLSIHLTRKSRMDKNAKEVSLPPHEKFITEVYLRIIDQSI